MNDIVKQMCNTGELLEIYTNPNDSDKFGAGYIVACTDNEFLVHSFQENDLDDGFWVMQTDSIIRIQRNTIYLNNMLQFIKPKAEAFELPKGYWPDLDLFSVALNLCQEKHLIAQVGVIHDFVRNGWVKRWDDNVLEMDCLDCDGMLDGTTYLRMGDIDLVGFGGIEGNRRTMLFNHRTKK